ncbi:MAG: SRPBCC domain-containing protein [Pseudomonadota bacterium]
METNQAKAELLIRSSVESVFDAFVNPQTIVKFWLDGTSGPVTPGATVTWNFMVPGARETVKVTAFSAPSHLAFGWSDGVKVDMQFRQHGPGASVVLVVASGFKELAQVVDAAEGFSIVLCDLKTLLELGASANLVRDKAALLGAAK